MILNRKERLKQQERVNTLEESIRLNCQERRKIPSISPLFLGLFRAEVINKSILQMNESSLSVNPQEEEMILHCQERLSKNQ